MISVYFNSDFINLKVKNVNVKLMRNQFKYYYLKNIFDDTLNVQKKFEHF